MELVLFFWKFLTYLQKDSRLGHVTCFGEWNIRKNTSTRLPSWKG